MNEAEKILEKFATKNMIQWNQESFKRSHSRLHKSIIEAINEALNLPDVVGQSEPSDCAHDWQSVFHHNNLIGRYCPNCEQLRAG